MSCQDCMAACWGVQLERVPLSDSSIPREPIPYLGTATSEAFGNTDLMCQCEKPGCPCVLLQLTKIRSGILNLHLNLHVGHLMLRSTICKINNPSVPLDLPDGCCQLPSALQSLKNGAGTQRKGCFKSTQNTIAFELTLLLHLMQKMRGFLGRQATYAFLQMPKQQL